MAPRLLAHGLGGVQDLPVPRWLFYWTAAVVLVASFALLGSLWRTPQLARRARGSPLPEPVSRLVLGPARHVVRWLSVAILGLVWSAALLGDRDPFENIAPTFVYVAFWLGLPLLSVLFGDVWRALSPWRALADGFVWVWERSGRPARPLATYPERLGWWPAAIGYFAFAVLELAYADPANPRVLAVAIAVYSYVALFGMAAIGRERWTRNADAFAVAFSLLARIAPLHAHGDRIYARLPLTGLGARLEAPGSWALLAAMLGTVLFDGYSRTTTWQDATARLAEPYVVSNPGMAELVVTAASIAGLLGASALVALAYAAACSLARILVAAPRSLGPELLSSLVPIAAAYLVAHYFSLFAVQGQFLVPLLSDPLGRGWNVFGTADWSPNLAPFAPSVVWYVQVGALVVGHVAGLAVAHDRSLDVFDSRGDAVRSQYAMLALMVLFTLGGLWVLSQG